MTDSTRALMQLLKCCVDPEFHPEKNLFGEETLEKVYDLAITHDLVQMAASALEQSGNLPENPELRERYERQMKLAAVRTIRMTREYDRICEVLEKQEIAYLPLKGAVIRALYPKPWMRTSFDVDLLVHPEDLAKAQKALEEVGYRTMEVGYHDISLFSPSDIHLELHFKITENMMPMDQVLERVWEFANPVTDSAFRYELSPEFRIFHAIAHMAYHFYAGGCGIRPILDLWLLEKKQPCEAALLNPLLAQAGLSKFYEGVEKLTGVWFEEKEPDALSRSMEAYILRGGVYGNTSNAVAVQRTKKQSQGAYLLSRIFPPYSMMRERNKILKKHPALLPFCWIRRLLSLLFSPGKRKKTAAEVRMNRAVTEETIDVHAAMLKGLGLEPDSHPEPEPRLK